jgi:hypothetical protein
MKKHILNRPMFRQVKSPAYGTGIATNLVSNEERQKYNYGGRVRAAEGLDYRFYTDRGQRYVTDYMPQTQEDWAKLQQIKAKGLPFQTIDEINQEVEESIPGQEPWYDWSSMQGFGESAEDYAARMAYEKSPTTHEAKRKDLLETRKKWLERGVDRVYPGLREERESVGLYTPGTDKSHPSQKGFDPKWGPPAEEIEEESVTPDESTEETPTRSERQPGWDLTEDSYSNFLKGRKKITPEGYEGVIDTDLMSDEINIDFENKKQKAKDLAKTLALFKGAEIAGNVFGQPTRAKMLGALGKGIGELGPTVTKPLAEVRKTEDVFEMQKALLREKGMEAQKKQILTDKNKFNMLTKANEWNKELQKEMADLDFKNKKALKELDPEGKLTKSETFLALVSKDPSATNQASVLNILTNRGATVFDTKNGTKAPKNMRQGDIVIDAQRKTIFVADENGVLQPTSLTEFGINVEETFAPN